MERLSGLDASFLYNETPSEHMHTLKLAVLDPPAGDPLPIEEVRVHFGRRMAAWPAFRRRIVRVPFDLYHPLWADAGPLDLDYHVQVAQIPEPGTTVQMDQVVARLASTQLDRSRPLWQAWMLHGRADGRLAVLIRVHHSVADGVAANALLASILSAENGTDPPDSAMSPRAEVIPGRMRLLLQALADRLANLRRLPGVIRETRSRMRLRRNAAEQLRRTNDTAPPRPLLDTPATSVNRAITAQRAVATHTLALAPMLHVKRSAGVSLNDVLLTIVGGALLEVLAANDEVPDRSLTAGVPVSSDPVLHPGDTPRHAGNKVSNLFVSLCTDIEDPLERLRAVNRSARSAKLLHTALGADLMETWLEYAPPKGYAWFMRLYSRLSVADHHRAPFNVIVSNVAGPREPLRVEGAELTDFFSSGPVLEGIGVNVTAWSYTDRLDVMVTSCARAMRTPELITAAMGRQLDALTGAIERTGIHHDTQEPSSSSVQPPP